MGAKDSAKFKLRRPAFKCDMCPKKFLSSSALANHIILVHKIKSKGKGQQPDELNTLLGKSVKTLDMATKSVEETDMVSEVEPAQVSDVRKIEYECPQCYQCFAVYFSAFRHIQKNHCINSNGEKVSLNSMEIIKPVRIEVCMKCNQRLRSKEPHSCSDNMCTSIDPKATYICMGCKQQFTNLKLFNMHVMGLHCDDVETLFFPSKDEFTSWKEDVESQVEAKYLILDKSSRQKQVYHCTYLAPSDNDEDNVVNFCPSSIFVRDFTKSIQVHFYNQHFGHDSKYKLPDKFSKYRIKQLLKVPTPITEPFELKSMHMDFKTLMNFLVLESTKCDKATLEVLHKKAQDMLTIVNNMDEPTKTSKRNMTDDQISETLESLDGKKKKKVDSPAVVAKTSPDPKATAPVILNSFSLASNAKTDEQPKRKLRAKQKKETPPIGFVMSSSPCSSKSSFNDSYREFVDKNFKPKSDTERKTDQDSKQKIRKVVSSNEIQLKPSPLAKITVSKPNILKNKKKIVKTKIGQFKPSLSPNKADDVSLNVKDRRSSIGKVDFEYEVREQENDCNILVLKF